ncbi:MAG: hypothetical protein WA981_08945 [Glaciecola sp.]
MNVKIDMTESELGDTKQGIISIARVLAKEVAKRDFEKGIEK